MSGVEIIGLILGSFPILLNSLEYYRKGFEPLDEWWHFRTRFIAFVDDIEHQMMRYNENMIRLLDPIISNNASLTALILNTNDSRWTDGSLVRLLEERLAGQQGRFMRIVEKMEEIIEKLKKLLQIRDGNVQWIDPEKGRPWAWHLNRIRISFSKGKVKRVKKLETHNQELQDILGYSDRIVPVVDARRISHPVSVFEEIRQHACAVYGVFRYQWRCTDHNCRIHKAYLRVKAQTESARLNLLFVLHSEQGRPIQPIKQEMEVRPIRNVIDTSGEVTLAVSDVQKATSFRAMQPSFQLSRSLETTSRSSRLFPQARKSIVAAQTSNIKKQVHFPTITVSQQSSAEIPPSADTCNNNSSLHHISDLCSILRSDEKKGHEIILEASDRRFELSQLLESDLLAKAPSTAHLVPLPEILHAHNQTIIELERQKRFGLAFHIASALLQTNMSPWLIVPWSKHKICLLADERGVYSDHPYVFGSFGSDTARPTGQLNDDAVISSSSDSEQETRSSLFTVGVIILELIFGHTIESCTFRNHYHGPNGLPNDQTDISTAHKWAGKVLGECGPEVADVVRRCLNCSFGPRPSFKDKRFREAVYEGVIKPLGNYLETWQASVP